MRCHVRLALTLGAFAVFVGGLMAGGVAVRHNMAKAAKEVGSVVAFGLKPKTAQVLRPIEPTKASFSFDERFSGLAAIPAPSFQTMTVTTIAVTPPVSYGYVAPVLVQPRAEGCSSLHPYSDAPGPC